MTKQEKLQALARLDDVIQELLDMAYTTCPCCYGACGSLDGFGDDMASELSLIRGSLAPSN